MRQKNATPTKEQQASMRKAELDPAVWVVTKEFPMSLIVHNRQTGE